MRVAIKKLDVADIGDLQALVIANIQGIEPGLTVLDSRLLLGHATMDLVAMDANASLVLVALGFSADEEMLLKAVEAYSWCLEYPEAIRRLYPAAQVSEDRPPRMIFVVGRVPDAFHRKVKQLGFQEVACVEFRHLAVDGTPVLYFETLVHVRRGGGERPVVQPAAPAAPASARLNGTQNESHKPRTAPPALDVPAPTVPFAAERASVVEEPLLPVAAAPLTIEEPLPVAALVDAGVPSEETAPPVPSPSMEPLISLLDQMTATAAASPMIEPMPQAEPLAPAPAMPTIEAPELVLESRPEPLPAPEPAGNSIAEAARDLLGAKSIEEAARAAFAAATPTFAERHPSPAPPAVTTPAAPAPPTPPAEKSQAQAEAAKPAAPLPQEFAGLNFPNDGVLTRQWMEFLNRMANSK